ncbi:MAG: acyltransferase family protein [Desulfobacterales bacterium]
MKKERHRLDFVDWLRVLAMFAIFFFHADRFFDFHDWHVKNHEQHLVSSIHVSFFSQWIMPLFFVLSGAAVFYQLKARSGRAFLRERVQRILIPLIIVGYFITSPPQMYLERLTHNRFEGSFFNFFPAYFQGVDMFGGNFAWHGFHLWYLVYLFIFSVILLPIFLAGKNSGTSVLSRLSNRFESFFRLLLLAIPLIIINIFIDLNGFGFMRGTGGWDLFSYLFIFAYGYMIFCNEKIMESIKSTWLPCLIAAIALSSTHLAVYYGIRPIINETTPVLYLLMALIRCTLVLLWIFALIGLGEKYLNFNNRFLGYANEAVLPFYILHQTVLLLIGYRIVRLQVHSFVKYVIISGISFITIMALYDFFIKRFPITRFLFGMKPKARSHG